MHLLTQGLAPTREQAQRLIRAGKVRNLFGQVLDKPGQDVPKDLALKVEESPRFVSRGGEKLLSALETFDVEINERVCLDGGISTGGFTDCLLQHGAAKVYGIDVGYGQTAWSIRKDSRVFLKERTNIRILTPGMLYKQSDLLPSLAVADLSFISLTIVIASIKALLHPKSPEAILLVKPQFEVGRERIGKGGVVRDTAAHAFAIRRVLKSALINNWLPRDIISSPITGAAGNQEYLLWLGGENKEKDFPIVENLVEKALSS